MQKTIKVGFVVYFLILLIILWTYISYSNTNVDLRMHVASTGYYDLNHPTQFALMAYENDQHFDFSNWRVKSAAVYFANSYDPKIYFSWIDNPEDMISSYFVSERVLKPKTISFENYHKAGTAIPLSIFEENLKFAIRVETKNRKKDRHFIFSSPKLPADGRLMINFPKIPQSIQSSQNEACQESCARIKELDKTFGGSYDSILFKKSDPCEVCSNIDLTLQYAWFLLIDPEGTVRKDVLVHLETAPRYWETTTLFTHTRGLTWAEPGPFLMHEKSDIFFDINGFDEDLPSITGTVTAEPQNPPSDSVDASASSDAAVPENADHTIAIQAEKAINNDIIGTKVTFGQAVIPSAIPISSLGLARTSLTVDTPSDIEFTYRGKSFYGNFTPNERPLRIEVPDPIIIPGKPLTVKVQTIVGNNDVTFNYYYLEAWLGQEKAHTDSIHPISLNPPLVHYTTPEIIILSGCLSAWDCKDSAQRVALIGTSTEMTLQEQALFAVSTYYLLSEGSPHEKSAYNLFTKLQANTVSKEEHVLNGFPPKKQQRPSLSDDELRLVRDYALTRIASIMPATEPKILARTEIADKEAKLRAKEMHRTIVNPLFIVFISSGIFAFVVAAIRSRIGRENYNFDNTPEQLSLQRIGEGIKRFLLYVILLAMGIGIAAGLYYMMQIL